MANNDLVLDSDWFGFIDREVENNPNVACFCGTVLTKDGTKYEGIGLDFSYTGKCKNQKNGDAFNPEEINVDPYYIWGSSAALVVYKKDIIKKIGLFDEDFFAYEEDVDLSLRLHNLGFKTLYIPKALCYHLGGGTSGKMGNFRHRMDAKNWIYIIIKNFSRKDILKNFFGIFLERLRNLSGIIKNSNPANFSPSVFGTYWQVIKNFNKMLKKRHLIQNLLKSSL